MNNSTNIAISTEHSHHSHDHGHSHDEPKRRCCRLTKTQSFIIIITLTLCFFFVEIIVGNITKSNALIADSFHMLSDVIALFIGFIALRMKKRKTSRNTFGYVRAEVLGSLINGVFLLALCFSILLEAIMRFVEPHPIEHVNLMLIVGGVGLGINIIGLFLFGSHGHDHVHSHDVRKDDVESTENNAIATVDGVVTVVDDTAAKRKPKMKKRKNLNIHGVFLHVLADALGSIAVMTSGFIVKYVPPQDDTTVTWKQYIDPALSVVIAILISISIIPLIKQSSLILLQMVPKKIIDIDELTTLIKSVKGVVDVRHLHVWSLDAEKIIASVHVCITKQEDNNERLVFEIKRLFHKQDIHSITLELYENLNKASEFCDYQECHKRQCCIDENEKKV